MMNKKWEISKPNEKAVEEIANKHKINTLLAKVLVNRNIINDNEVEQFLNPTRKDFYNPYLMPDMKKAVERRLISKGRYERYCTLYEKLKGENKW